MRTFFDKAARQHCLAVQCGALAGRVVLMDASKSAWQANIGDDLEGVVRAVSEMVRRIELAGRGEYDAEPPEPRSRVPQFPFPDQIPPPQG